MDTGDCGLDGSAAGSPHKADLPDQSQLPASPESLLVDRCTGCVSSWLPGDDLSHDGPIEYATVLHSGVCQPTPTVSLADARGFFGGICSCLDRFRSWSIRG